MPIEFDRRAVKPDETLTEVMERTANAVEQLVELQRAGTRGIEGTEVVPELRVSQLYMPPVEWTVIPANRRRARLLMLQASHGDTVPDDAAGAIALATHDTMYKQLGEQTVLALDALTPHTIHATNTLYIRPVDISGATIAYPETGSWVLILEEST